MKASHAANQSSQNGWHGVPLRDKVRGNHLVASGTRRSDTAWRISVRIDGVVGMLAFERTPLTVEAIGRLLDAQIAMELKGTA